ncbi:MAG: hypothetical protein ACREQ8_05920, partial [Woeseiaceae bacterium]
PFQERREYVPVGFGRNIPVSHDPEKGLPAPGSFRTSLEVLVPPIPGGRLFSLVPEGAKKGLLGALRLSGDLRTV